MLYLVKIKLMSILWKLTIFFDELQEEGTVPTLRKGILLQARDRLFSRWKERYFILTRDYLACFRRSSTKYSEMGSFIFKVSLKKTIVNFLYFFKKIFNTIQKFLIHLLSLKRYKFTQEGKAV